jgi:two-component system alkaline phosphatase synthesis response regulator PhoP
MARLGRVLIADDEASMRFLCRINLEADGTEVIEATEGSGVLDLARETKPDVVILDVMMPGKNGFDVAEELIGDPQTKDLPIVFLSARAELDMQAQGIELGGFEYLTKPFDVLALRTTLERVLETAERGEGEASRAALLAELRKKMTAA